MKFDIMKVEYYNTTVENDISIAANLVSTIADIGVDFNAFKAVPLEGKKTQFTFFAKESSKIIQADKTSELKMDGPYSALLIKGNEEAGALAYIYRKMAEYNIHISEASGIADIFGGYGVLLYLNEEDCDKAINALSK